MEAPPHHSGIGCSVGMSVKPPARRHILAGFFFLRYGPLGLDPQVGGCPLAKSFLPEHSTDLSDPPDCNRAPGVYPRPTCALPYQIQFWQELLCAEYCIIQGKTV